MKKIVLGIVALLFAIVLTSCGSADTASSETSATPAGGAAPAASTPPPAAEEELAVPRQFEVKQNTPQFFQDALKAKEPLLVLFYSEDPISQEVMSAVKTVYTSEKYSGVVKFLLLKIENEDEIGAVDDGDGSGEIIELARAFSVGYVPLTAVLNRDGTVIFEMKGYVDTKVLEQALYSATNK